MALVAIILVAIILIFVIGGLIVGFALKLLWWALIGLAIGAIARAILPGKQNISIIATAGAGIGAAIVGGIIAHVFDLGSLLQFLVALGVAVLFVGLLGGTRYARI